MSYDISPSLSDLLQTVSIWHSLGSSTLLLMALVIVAQSCQTLCDPMGYRVHGILQARILEWVAFSFLGDLPNPGIDSRSPTLQADSLPAEPQRSPRYWSGEPIPSPGNLPDPGIELGSPALQVDSLPAELWGKPTKKKASPNKTTEENGSLEVCQIQNSRDLEVELTKAAEIQTFWIFIYMV